MRTPGQVGGDFSRKIGRRIRWLREIQDLTMTEIQKRCGIQGKTLARYECGGISISANAIEQIAIALNVRPTRLCGPLDDFSQLVREQVGAIESPLDLANNVHEPRSLEKSTPPRADSK